MGKIFRIGAIGVAALLLIPVLTLALAHRQIRTIDPALPDYETVLAAVDPATGQGPTRVFHVNTFLQRYSTGRLAGSPAFVLEWADGRRFMIDVGMDRATSLEFGRGSEIAFGASPAKALGTVAEQLGPAARAIVGLAFTHLHHDHTQGIVALCESRPAPLPIYQTPFQFAVRNYTTEMGYRFIEEVHTRAPATGCAAPTELAAAPSSADAGDASIYPIPGFPGLVALAAGGHTPGSTMFLARIGSDHFFFSGDITNSRRHLVENQPKGNVYSWLIVPEFPSRLEKLRVWIRGFDERADVTAVVSHDQSVLDTLPIPAWADLDSGR